MVNRKPYNLSIKRESIILGTKKYEKKRFLSIHDHIGGNKIANFHELAYRIGIKKNSFRVIPDHHHHFF